MLFQCANGRQAKPGPKTQKMLTSDSHSSVQSLAPTTSPNQEWLISWASLTIMEASPPEGSSSDWEMNVRLGLDRPRPEKHLKKGLQ